MHYSNIIKAEHIDEYIEMQKTLFTNFSRILFDVVYLKKAVENNDFNLFYDSSLTIRDLFQNTFQYLVLKIWRSLFDTGSNAITLSKFRNSVQRKFLKDEFRQLVYDSLLKSQWQSEDVQNVYKRVKLSLPKMRTHYIAHNLQGETDEIMVALPDIELLFRAAIEMLELLSFETADLYKPFSINETYFVDEEKAMAESCDIFFSYQYLSSRYISKISCEYEEYYDSEEKEIVQKHIDKINHSKSK